MPIPGSDICFREDAVTALPPAGGNHDYWQELILESRTAALSRARDLFGEYLPLRQLLSFSLQTQQRFILTPEYGHWISWMNRRLQGQNAESYGPSLEGLKEQTNYFLLAGLVQEPDCGTGELKVPLLPGGFIPLPGSGVFLKLADEDPARPKSISCSVNGSELLFQRAGMRPAAFAINELRDGGSGTGVTRFALTGLSMGAYRLPTLPRVSTVVGLPVSTYFGVCLAGMSGGSEGSRPVRYPENVAAATQDLSTAIELLSESWPEVGSALDLLVKVIVPVQSDVVLSYSESAAPHVVFVRTNPLNPLWYVELLVHEWAHTWLATLLELFPFVHGDDRSQHSSPWRVDKRPIQGVLFATHAFAMVTILLHRQLGRGLVEGSVLARRIGFEANRVHRGNQILRECRGFTRGGRILVESLGVLVDEALRRAADCGLADLRVSDEALDRIWPTAIHDA